MELYHDSDIAIELIDGRDDLEKSLSLDNDFHIPSSCKGIVKLIRPVTAEKLGIKIGDQVYFDPKMLVEIEELKLVIVDEKSILMKG